MANINENLLKLSDFPFSYSFILGLFFVLVGHNLTLPDILTSKFAPLLAVMGFVGTALAISDPFGRLLRKIGIFLNRRDLPLSNIRLMLEDEFRREDEFLDPTLRKILDRVTHRIESSRWRFSSKSDLSHEEDRNLRSFQLSIQRRMIDSEEALNDVNKELERIEATYPNKDDVNRPSKIEELKQKKQRLQEALQDSKRKNDALIALRYNIVVPVIGKRSVETTWIHTEIDKIVAMFYFTIIISMFTIGIFLNPTIITNAISTALNSTALNTVARNNSSSSNHPSSGTTLMTSVLQLIFVIFILGIMTAIYFSIGTLRRRIKTVSIYMIATGRESPELNDYIKKVQDYLSNKEWEMAELWADKLREQF